MKIYLIDANSYYSAVAGVTKNATIHYFIHNEKSIGHIFFSLYYSWY